MTARCSCGGVWPCQGLSVSNASKVGLDRSGALRRRPDSIRAHGHGEKLTQVVWLCRTTSASFRPVGLTCAAPSGRWFVSSPPPQIIVEQIMSRLLTGRAVLMYRRKMPSPCEVRWGNLGRRSGRITKRFMKAQIVVTRTTNALLSLHRETEMIFPLTRFEVRARIIFSTDERLINVTPIQREELFTTSFFVDHPKNIRT